MGRYAADNAGVFDRGVAYDFAVFVRHGESGAHAVLPCARHIQVRDLALADQLLLLWKVLLCLRDADVDPWKIWRASGARWVLGIMIWRFIGEIIPGFGADSRFIIYAKILIERPTVELQTLLMRCCLWPVLCL